MSNDLLAAETEAARHLMAFERACLDLGLCRVAMDPCVDVYQQRGLDARAAILSLVASLIARCRELEQYVERSKHTDEHRLRGMVNVLADALARYTGLNVPVIIRWAEAKVEKGDEHV